jgi:hypothetical protein
MTNTPEHTIGSRLPTRIQGMTDEVFGPVRAPHGTPRHRLQVARSVAAYFCLVTTLVQIVVWLVIGVLTAHLDTPWWLWTTVPAAGVVLVLTAADRWHGWFTSAQASTPSSTHR